MICLLKLLVALAGILSFCYLPESNIINDHELHREHRSVISSEDNCIYTFNVPKTDANACPPGSFEVTKENFQDFKESMLSQFNALREQITNLSQQIIQSNLSVAETIQSNLSAENDYKPQDYQIGVHYTRWGSTSCPGTAELIYDGMAGKSLYSQGGGVNYLCLPKDPDFEENLPSGYQSYSCIYGVEYERKGSPLMPAEKQNLDAPCAVCHVSGRGEQMMIPAKKTCPSGWTLEYQGILMAQHYSHKGSDFVCVDKGMEVLYGGHQNSDGGLFYVVESVCGALKCPPYADGKEILCVVCTK